ncbi:unnamed protein product [Coffea canephora]|uniref:PRP8 domain-containing protein n=1 Tax=Coffea canephora TaxID=49390 RepID=A0A068U7N6_COFCA|nr:unnamed protein product [Coffea canephora]
MLPFIRSCDGKVTAQPINYTIFLFDPRTWQLFLEVICTSTCTMKKHLSRLSKWKTAKEMAAVVRSLLTL